MVDLDALEAELSASIGKDKTCDVMPIIRRAVSPSAPEGLRDRIADVLVPPGSIGAFGPNHREELLKVADAVLAVLSPPAPRVDVDDELVIAKVKAYGSACERGQYDYANELLAAIRAMLEGAA